MSKHKTGFCPICLQAFSQAATLDCCHHQYCLQCIREWSKVTSPPPRQKQSAPYVRNSSNISGRPLGGVPEKRGREGEKRETNGPKTPWRGPERARL